MGQNQVHSLQLNSQAMSQYQIIERSAQFEITKLKNIKNNQQYMLREHRFNQLRQFTTLSQRLQKRIKLKHKNLTNLQKMQTKTQDQLCSNFYKIYTLWQYPRHCLVNQISDRVVRNQNFQDKELWNIIISVIEPMALIENNHFRHQTLSTKTILIDHQGIIKVADTYTNTFQNNLEYIYANRSTKNIYPSPQQCDSIVTQKPILNKNPYKNDVFTFGIIMLQCGLLQSQQKCYFQQYQGINWRLLNQHINHFGNIYGMDLKKTIQIMTKKTYNERPSWVQLSHVISLINMNNKVVNNNGVKIAENNSSFSNSYEMSSSNSNSPFSESASFGTKNLPAQTTNIQQIYYPPPPPPVQLPINTIPTIINNKPQNIPITTTTTTNNKTTIITQEPLPINKVVLPTPINTTFNPANIRPQQRITNVQVNNPQLVPSPLTINHHYQQHIPNNNNHPQIKLNPNIVFVNSHHQQQNISFNNGAFNRQPQQQQNNKIMIVNPPITQPQVQPQMINHQNTFKKQPQHRSSKNLHIKQVVSQNEHEGNGNEQLEYVEERFKMGSRYEGYKLNGLRHGRGKFYYQDGGSYDGEWKLNKMSGYGKLYYQSNKIAYEGDWVDDQFQGKGKLYNENPIFIQTFDYLNFDQIDQNWEYYEGQFLADLKNGKGKLKFSSGQIFQGNFFDDMVQGEGTFTFNDGHKIRAIWHQNMLKEYIK